MKPTKRKFKHNPAKRYDTNEQMNKKPINMLDLLQNNPTQSKTAIANTIDSLRQTESSDKTRVLMSFSPKNRTEKARTTL